MRSLLLAALCLTPLAAHAAAEDAASGEAASSVQVRTEPAKQGSLPELLRSYGSAAPALNGNMTLSVQQEGRVVAIYVTPGETVQAGERLIDFAASPLAASNYSQAVTALSLAKSQRDHTAQLLAQQLATRDQLGQANKAVSDAQAALDALRHEGAGASIITLSAPFDGIVASVPVAQGDRVQPAVPLATLTRLDGLVVTVGIGPSDRTRVKPGEKAHLEPLQGGDKLDGQVKRMDGVLNAKTRLIDADISVPTGSVISGESFAADIEVGELKGWIVPHDAVQTDDTGSYIFQVDKDKAARVDVKLVGSNGDDDVVDGKLDPTRKVVVEGSYQLADGTKVREAEPEKTAEGGKPDAAAAEKPAGDTVAASKDAPK